MTKPFQIEEVLARVEHQLALQRSRAALRTIREAIDGLARSVDLLQSGAAPDPDRLSADIATQIRQLKARLDAEA